MKKDELRWPSDGDLRELARESQEHRRAWALVGGLSRRLLNERTHPGNGPSTEEQSARIAQLEQRIVKQKKALSHLEECRTFERETERLLADALRSVINATCLTVGAEQARWALEVLEKRKGPRPQEADAS